MAIFYYAICIEGNNWTATGNEILEPIHVEGQEPFGRDPEFCCDELREQLKWERRDWFAPRREWEPGMGLVWVDQQYKERRIRFCPFCGERVAFVHHLDLKVIETKRTIERTASHYEIAREFSPAGVST